MRSALSRILGGATIALIAAIASPRAESAPPVYRAYANPGYGYYTYHPGGYAAHYPGTAGYGYRHYPAYPSVTPYAGGYSSPGVRAQAQPAPRRHSLPGSGRVDPGAHISRPWLKNLPKGWGSH